MLSERDETSEVPARGGVSRRALITGAGAGAALLTAGALAPDTVAATAAKPAVPPGDGTAHSTQTPRAADGQPITTAIGSPAVSGYAYRSACMYDFRPFNPAAQVTWGGIGVYSAGTATALRATFDVPAAARVQDIEWYVYNNSANPVYGSLYQYAPGAGTISSLGAEVMIPPSGTSAVAVRGAVPSSANGPFSIGSKLLAGLSTPTDGSIQINGVRLGFTQGVGETGLLPTPIRAYDSRVTGGRLAAGSTRTITLPSSVLTPGVTGVLANITATGASGGGFLKVYPGNAAAPAASTLNFETGPIANAIVVGVSNTGQIKVYASRSVHVIVDLTGTVS